MDGSDENSAHEDNHDFVPERRVSPPPSASDITESAVPPPIDSLTLDVPMEQGSSTAPVTEELGSDLLLTPPAKIPRADPSSDRSAVRPQSSSNPVGLSDSPRTDVQLQDTSFGSGALAPNQPEPQPWAPAGSSFTTFRAPERSVSPQPGPSRPRLFPSPPPAARTPLNRTLGPSMHPLQPSPSALEAGNPYINLHPWAHLIVPMPMPTAANNNTVTSEHPLHAYRHLPESGYLGIRYLRSLFPRQFVGQISATNRLPVMDLMRINHAIDFRLQAETVIRQMERGSYVDADNPLPVTPTGEVPSTLYPDTINGFFPVLYQVVARGHGQGVILEAKDFFIVGPDHRELHCIVLDQYATNVRSNTRGFDLSLLSVKDLVWVYSVKPTRAALANPGQTLTKARRSRITALDTRTPYYFRVDQFTFVTPPESCVRIYGIVLDVVRRGRNINNLRIAFEGTPDVVTVSPKVCQFRLDDVNIDDFVVADARENVSTAIRFSEPPANVDAREALCGMARNFQPAHPDEGLLPLAVYLPSRSTLDWLEDRAGPFLNYSRDPTTARKNMARVFTVACSTLAAVNSMNDDTTTHFVTATVPSPTAFPVRLQFQLPDMTSECGWTNQRPVHVWFVNTNTVVKMSVQQATYSFDNRTLSVQLATTIGHHKSSYRVLERRSRVVEDQRQINICVKLGRVPAGSDPVFEFLARNRLFSLLHVNPRCRGNVIVDTVYSSDPTPQDQALPNAQQDDLITTSVAGREITLRQDQSYAVHAGDQDIPLLAIQAAFGTGKTVVGALITARVAAATGSTVIATATTNTAVAQFADTLLRLDHFRDLSIVRFASDSALIEGAPRTPVDLDVLLKRMATDFGDVLLPKDLEACETYAAGRELLEAAMFNPESTLHLSEEERDQYRIAEQQVSATTETVVNLLLALREPRIFCMTTAALLNSTDDGGIFAGYLNNTTLLVGDEASQIPEPTLLALATRFRSARHIYIGDVHQLEPHVRVPRASNAAKFGGKGVMEILVAKGVPVAPLRTTFRAHPGLNDLPNSLFYEGTLVSGTPAADRRLLLDRFSLPNPSVPFLFIDVPGTSVRAANGSHSNATEANTCRELVTALLSKNIPPESIAIITFYKEQFRVMERFAGQHQIDLHTVDSVQGREKDIVILLTTRTSIQVDRAEFLDDPLRMNVAITRCRHEQFVLGNTTALSPLQNWGRLIRWATALNTVVSTTTLPDILE